MEVIKMQTNNFWKGEVGVRGLVEDQAQTYNVSLYVKGGRVKDYSCSCAEGNSYKGMCAHGKALSRIMRTMQNGPGSLRCTPPRKSTP